MKKTLLILSLMIILGTLACGSATPPAPPETASATEAAPTPEPDHLPAPSSVAEPKTDTKTELEQSVPDPTGLRVVYIREGNLWSWTEAGGNVQLTGTGDMSTARLSRNGQLLVFMRGREVWTVGMDGMGARLLSTQANEGGALWFSPDGSLLAVSTKDHIDVISLEDATSVTVVTYPVLLGGNYPEVVWSPDASGFKSVILPQTKSNQAELIFAFTDGTVASLAKFAIIPFSESLPYISPDGGYVIYAAKVSDGKESLYLMDSSGATKPYGEPADHIRANSWLPDSKHFVYSDEALSRAFLGDVGGAPLELAVTFSLMIRWVDAEHYIALENGELMLSSLSGANVPIDSAVFDFDFMR